MRHCISILHPVTNKFTNYMTSKMSLLNNQTNSERPQCASQSVGSCCHLVVPSGNNYRDTDMKLAFKSSGLVNFLLKVSLINSHRLLFCSSRVSCESTSSVVKSLQGKFRPALNIQRMIMLCCFIYNK